MAAALKRTAKLQENDHEQNSLLLNMCACTSSFEKQSKTRLHSTNFGRTHLSEADEQIKDVGIVADRCDGEIVASQLRNL